MDQVGTCSGTRQTGIGESRSPLERAGITEVDRRHGFSITKGAKCVMDLARNVRAIDSTGGQGLYWVGGQSTQSAVRMERLPFDALRTLRVQWETRILLACWMTL